MIKKAVVTLCALVSLAMPVTANGWFLDLTGPPTGPLEPIESVLKKIKVINFSKVLITYVRSGDSLWEIAEKFYGTGKYWQKIADTNGIFRPPYTIHPGQKLYLP